ncbi:MAG: AI-2E family transporter [Alphaproteobacteria bacterium]|nr:AI-2E family transporter [Rhodospirillaceae bacterium]MDG2482920.1 AI-2E family transporter [Alphaproteobacteria bacterium]MBT6205185.1 AI-2E family transporter [Rhodospirillaceae bacterium]MBT6509487.1 AI-2E family transporter [Rhodospirillaceae bacterium]MBT7614948.1 AI-2E family transporter [Rhodospirillaceae bacterium]
MNLLSFSLYTAIAGFTLYLLIVGKALILPIVVAVVFWYLIATLARTYSQLGTWGFRLPGWLAMTFAVLTFVALLVAFVDLTRNNVEQVVAAAPAYQANLEKLLNQALAFLGIQEVPTVDQLRKQIDLGNIAGQLAAGLASFAGNVGIILIYVVFLLVEQKSFGTKIEVLVDSDPARIARVRRILDRVNADVRTYIWVKTLLSLATGGISYLVMIAVGVDLAEFWAVLIFLLNFIPTIGSILGIVFPALLTLVQFDDPLTPFLIVSILLGATQLVIGNVVEPKMMGRSLSISPVVILISLAVWGSIWGVIGMFLSVPIMVIAMIVMAQFKATRPIAILLSSDGNVSHLEDEEPLDEAPASA